MELLELPSWLRLTSAWCNHVSFRVTWTKLKSTPIILTLDEVNIAVETCEIARSGTPTANAMPTLAVPQGKYSFIHKIVDGITIIVNTVNVKFRSPAFTASVQMSRIRVESRTPKWIPGDLRVTRLKDPTKGIILIFKELSWQTVRIEASSTQDKFLTPLRLLTNQAKCRITIKKKLSDCSILASKLVLILDDLLWVLTDSQLKAALHFVDSLSGLIQASTRSTQRTKAQKKLETLPEYHAQLAQSSRATQDPQQLSAAQKMFKIFDVRETSYHFFSQRIDLHLCDDAGTGRSSYPRLKDGGALQISVQGFQIDYYPYHLAKADRSHWPKYKESAVPPAQWLEQSLNDFREKLLNLSQPNRPPSHPSLERTPNMQQKNPFGSPGTSSTNGPHSGTTTPSTPTAQSAHSSPMKRHVLDNVAKLMSSCIIMKVEDFTLYRVTTSGCKQMPKEFISGDRDRCSFPPEMPTLHAEFTYFYYPGDFVFPLPPSKAFIHINPVQVNFDIDSCLWFSSFILNLHKSLLKTSVSSALNSPTSPTNSYNSDMPPSVMYMDVKVEVIMPRVVFEASPNAPQQKDRPKAMQIQVARFAITNIREMGASRADLAQAISSLQEGSLVFGTDFPSKKGDMCIVTDRILSHVAATDISTQSNTPMPANPFGNLKRYALWTEPRDVWCIKLDPVWVDFYGARSVGASRAIPFVDAVPVTIWLHAKTLGNDKLPDGMDMFDMDKQDSDNSNSIKSSDSLILSVNSLKNTLGFESNLFECSRYERNEMNVQYSKLTNFTNGDNLVNNNPLIGDNVKKKTNNYDTNSEHLDSEEEENATNKVADLHIIAHVSNLVSVQIDHYQYLFLLRLAEKLTELATFLSLDSKRILQEENTETSVIVGCVIPQVEVSLVMPSQTPGKEPSGGDGESVVPDSVSLGDEMHMISTGWNISLDQTRNSNVFGSVETPSPIINEAPVDILYQSNPNTHGHNVQIQSVPTTTTTSGVASAATSSSSTASKQKTQNFAMHEAGLPKEISSSFSSMKKGFTSWITSIDSGLKTNISADMSDTISIQSDISSDSEKCQQMFADDKTTDCTDGMFNFNFFSTDNNMKGAPIEVASEVREDPYLSNMSSPSEPSESSSLKRRDLVSMVTFRLTTVEVIRQNIGTSSSIRLQVSALNCDECGAIPWDEFQTGHHKTKTKFGARCRAWNIAPHNSEAPPCIALRLEGELSLPADAIHIADKKDILSWFSRKVNVKVKDLSLQLLMSTAIGLGDLAEDEVLPVPIPMHVELENVKLNLIEDRPPVNITSPGTLPVNLSIGKMLITRDDSGVFCIQPDMGQNNPVCTKISESRKDRDREVISLQLVMQQLKLDNDNLKKRLSTAENVGELSKKEVGALLDEKRTLMDTIRSLQNQLTSNDMTLSDDKR